MRGRLEDEGFDTKDRLKAAETLGKAQRDFVDVLEVEDKRDEAQEILRIREQLRVGRETRH